MNESLIQIVAAIAMVAAAFALFVAVRRYMAATSERRMSDMLDSVGLDLADFAGAHSDAIVKGIRQRCRTCESEDVCERWLSGEVRGSNAFCPNAKVFEALKKSISAAG